MPHTRLDVPSGHKALSVLSIAKLSPSDAPGRGVRYYIDRIANDRDDYYTGSGEAPGRWMGAGSKALGLSGRVSPEAYLAVMEGRHPHRGDALVPPADDRLPGYDLTFSAPKSVSLLWAFGESRLAGRVMAAHDNAVAATIKAAEAEACFVRRGHGGANVAQGVGFVAAAFRHRSSRAGDPHLHTHVVVANLTKGPEGRWSAPDGRPLYVWATTLGSLYRAELRAELARLGVEWEARPNGLAEAAAIPRAILRAFSRRRSEIETDMAAVGGSSARSAEVAQRRTRLPKDAELAGAHDDALRQRWRDQLGGVRLSERAARPQDVTAAFALNATRVVADRRRLTGMAAELVGTPEADSSSSASLTAHASTFSRRDVIRSLANRAVDGARIPNIVRVADDLLASKEVVPLLPHPNDPGALRSAKDVIRTRDGRVIPALAHDKRYSTPEMLAVESGLVELALSLRDSARGKVTERRLAGVLAPRVGDLSTDQAAAVGSLCRSGDGVEVVVGPAGSGKTAMLDLARRAWEAEGLPVIGAALAARAAAELEDGAGIASSTIHRLLVELDSPSSPGLRAGSVVVIDEAGVVGSRMLARLLAHTDSAGGKLVLVGDHHQLPEVDAGGAFRGLVNRLGALSLTQNHRQAAPDQAWERTTLSNLRSGDIHTALDAYAGAGRLVCSEDAEAGMQAVLEHWWTLHNTSPLTTVAMMAVTNSEVEALNARARALLISAGELGQEMIIRSTGTRFAVGDRVVATENDRRVDLLNGTFGTVRSMDPDNSSLEVITDKGAVVTVPPYYLAEGNLTHGYATTVHKAQGATVDVGLLYAGEALYREAGYVGLSRGRRENHVYAVGGENHRWEIGHGRDGIIPPDALESLVVHLSRSKAQALASEHLASIKITGAESARAAFEARHALGAELRAEAPRDRRADLVRARADLERHQAEHRLARRETEAPPAPETDRQRRWGRRVEAERPVEPDRLRVTAADVEASLAKVSQLERDQAEREAWVEASLDRIAAYHQLGQRLADWERRLGHAASFSRPEHVIARLGPQPQRLDASQLWESAAGAIEGYRQRWGVLDPKSALGPEPEPGARHADFKRAGKAVERSAALGRQRERELGLELSLELSA